MPDCTDVSARNKIEASILGGAIGDALGFPIEGVFSFPVLLDKFGPAGIQAFIPPIAPFNDQKHLTAGDTTDDTAMVIATAAAIVETHHKSHQLPTDALLHTLWQSYMAWGENQSGGEAIAPLTDKTIKWADWFSICRQNSGASHSTLAALSEGRMGTLENPMLMNKVIRGKTVQGLNKGNGAMMRVAPLGFIPISESCLTDLALQSAAITHGAAEAQTATAAIALTIRNVFNGNALTQSLEQAITFLESNNIEAHQKCSHAFNIASKNMKRPISCEIADTIPTQMGYRSNKFMAIPVLGQVTYGVMIAEKFANDTADKNKAFRAAISTIATTSGDSDTAASILGNILGAAWGTECLPQDLMGGLHNKAPLQAAAYSLSTVIHQLNLEQRV